MDKSRGVKVGLVGLGYWGKNILRNLCELGRLHSACDVDQSVVEQRKKDFPGVNYVASFDDILNHPDIEAVFIATPAVTHYEMSKQALNAGKDVFVEKPIALEVSHGEELVRLAEERGKILMVGHILQYHPAVIRLKEMIKNGELGKVQYIYSNRLNMGKFRTEENILWSFAPHDISVILGLVGDEPVEITSSGGSYLNEGIFDTTLTNLRFRNNVSGHVFVSWIHPFKEQKLVVVASKAMAVFDDMAEEKLLIYPHSIKWENGKIPVAYKAEHKCVEIEKKEPLKEEIKHFVECVRNRKKPKTDGREGLRVLKVLDKAGVITRGESIGTPVKDKGYLIHHTSSVADGVDIGKGTKIWNYSQVMKNCKIGKNCILGQNVSVGPDVVIGNGVKIQNNVSVYKGVTIEDDVFCGPSCVFTNVYTPRAFIERKNEFMPTSVKKGASIGANATIVCGVTIGKYAFVGAGAVVKSDVPDYAVVVGVPAKQKAWACKCGVTLKKYGENGGVYCSRCKSEYRVVNNKLESVKKEAEIII